MVEPKAHAVKRSFSQASDSVSFYSDYAHALGTGNEVIVQFYESVPGMPTGDEGPVKEITTRLRATITVSPVQAAKIGELLLKQSKPDTSEGESK